MSLIQRCLFLEFISLHVWTAACYWDLMLCWHSQGRDTRWVLLMSATSWSLFLSGELVMFLLCTCLYLAALAVLYWASFSQSSSRDIKKTTHINLTLQRTTKNSLSQAGFKLASLGFCQLSYGGIDCESNLSARNIFVTT